MTNIYNKEGIFIPCTIIEAGPCTVTHVKTVEKDGYASIQLGFGEKTEKHTPAAEIGHYKKSNTTPKAKVSEFKGFIKEFNAGDIVDVNIFTEGDIVDVSGVSKGKGFQGVVKRHGFKGVGSRTHGQHDRQRAPGSMGASSFPSRSWPGKKMGGRMGGKNRKSTNLRIEKILAEKNLILVRGSVPGYNGSYIKIEK